MNTAFENISLGLKRVESARSGRPEWALYLNDLAQLLAMAEEMTNNVIRYLLCHGAHSRKAI